MIIVKTASNAGAIFNPVAFESMNVAATTVTANFATVDSGDSPSRDALIVSCTAGTEHAVANDLLQLIRSERTVTLDDVANDFAGISDVTGLAVTLNGTPVNRTFRVITPADNAVISTADSGAMVILGTGIDVKLPAPQLGLEYTFVNGDATIATAATVIATSDGSTEKDLFFGHFEVANANVPVANVGKVTFSTDSVEGDFFTCRCVSTTSTDNNPTWHVFGLADASGALAGS